MPVTVTLNDCGADALPLASVAVQVTVVVPTANFAPLAVVQVTTGAASCVSVATVVNETLAPLRSVVLSAMSAIGASVGAVVSATNAPVAVAAAEPPVTGRMTLDALVSTVTTAARVPATPIE